ncbi:uncharacterized protein K460DRAFT_67935 [Cucurbitaria berberidis CBS 394.84]|uniref:DUF6604 domain-containing protein n=1 Tax=Cucurbitaria berberidis CBS 394.84 TaxID=1168544 RepID=A0A9P4GLY6_9PLEO|nr:uncharacterized protein K460DRAFT_67935 [Cucurbitaria berberidis CBS 394.84]KAF1848087.1 hypothetical protein K460DRAFT_67935 [Cucurbitaria berberidis CBS 394.84]
MLPDNVWSACRQYKRDTREVASWLRTTANNLGFTSRAATRARRRSRKKSAKYISTYAVSTKEYIAMAELIAANKDQVVQASATLRIVLDRTIEVLEFYLYMRSRRPVESTVKQIYDTDQAPLLEALKKVRDILASRHASGFAPRGETPDSSDEPEHLLADPKRDRVLAAIQSDPLLADLELGPATTSSSREEKQVEDTSNLSDGIEDDFLAIQLFLLDLNYLRSEVTQAWDGYKQGVLDLVTASLVTDTAVSFACSLEDDCKEQYTKHGGIYAMLKLLYNEECIAHNTTPGERDQPGDKFNFKMYDTIMNLFLVPFRLLTEYLDVQRPSMVPDYGGKDSSDYDPSSDRASKNNRQRFLEDRRVMIRMLPEFTAMTSIFERSPAEDELTVGIRNMFETKEVTLSLAFASQLFIDIHNRLRDKAQAAFFKLSAVASFTRNNIKENFRFHEGLRSSSLSAGSMKQMSKFSDNVFNYILRDPHRYACQTLWGLKLPDPYYFLRQHPWASGVWKFYVQTELHTGSIFFMGAWGAIQSCGHLYNAVRQEKLLETQWIDMIILFGTNHAKELFVGYPPWCPEDYLVCLKMAIEDFAVNSEPSYETPLEDKTTTFNASYPGSSNMAPVIRKFKERYCSGKPSLELRAEDVDSFIRAGRGQRQFDAKGQPMPSVTAPGTLIGHENDPQRGVPANQLLCVIRDSVESQMLELSVDYLTLHRACWGLLRSIKDRCRDRLVELFGQEYIEDESQLPRIVEYIFKESSENADATMLKDAATVIEEMLETDMGNAVGKLIKEKFGLPLVL